MLHFVGCAAFSEDQCGLRINGIPSGRLEENEKIQLNNELSLRVEEISFEEMRGCFEGDGCIFSILKLEIVVEE